MHHFSQCRLPLTMQNRAGYGRKQMVGIRRATNLDMMKVAIPQWQGRVSPVFDVAGNLLIAGFDEGIESSREHLILAEENLHSRAERLAGAGVDFLICGAISWPLEVAVSATGIKVISQICGEIEPVLTAFLAGRLARREFLMPGCCRQRRRCCAQHRAGSA